MKTKYSQMLILFHVLYVLLYSNNISGLTWPLKPGSQKYCGPMLSNILEDLCIEYKSNPSIESKRSNSIGDDYLPTKQDSPFLNHRYVLSSLFRRARRDGDIRVSAHDECCEKGCTINELLDYCAKSRYTGLIE